MRELSKYALYIIAAVIGLASCTKERIRENGPAIGFILNIEEAETKVTLFEGSGCLTDKSNGGGDFRLYAYVSGSGQVAIDNARVNYIEVNGVKDWHFRDEKGTPDYDADDVITDYYWPPGQNLDFFAYMPMKTDGTGVALGTYSGISGPSFSCDLPLDNEGQENLQEFIYAYTEDQNIDTQNAGGGVNLRFTHPFACVIFKLGQSYRIDIDSISLTEIYNKGTFAAGQWSGTGKGDLVIEIDRSVPDQINYHSLIGGPYMVMPQSFENNTSSQLVMKYDYLSDTGLEGKIDIRALSSRWEAGKIYTYTINKGDSNEEVVFSVKVDEWDVVGYPNEVDVE